MLELYLDNICVTKKARGLQIEGKINIGLHPVSPVPVSLSSSLWLYLLLVLICLWVWLTLGTRCDTTAYGTTPTVVQKQQMLKHRSNTEVGVLIAWQLCCPIYETGGRYSCCRKDGQMKQHVPHFFEIAKLFRVKFSDTLVWTWYPGRGRICVWVKFAKITSKWEHDLLKESTKYWWMQAMVLNNSRDSTSVVRDQDAFSFLL